MTLPSLAHAAATMPTERGCLDYHKWMCSDNRSVPESSLLTREITGPARLKARGFVNLTLSPLFSLPPTSFYNAEWSPEPFTAE